jgi:hypothetical protein
MKVSEKIGSNKVYVSDNVETRFGTDIYIYVKYLETINHKRRQVEPEVVVSKIWVVTFTALLALLKNFTKVQNEEKLSYIL